MPTKRRNTKRAVRKHRAKPNAFRSNFRLGDYHQLAYEWYNSAYVPSTTARIKSRNISEVFKGDLLNNRQTNLTYIKNVQYVETVKNLSPLTRFLRVMFVSVRGSLLSVDPTNWSNLLIDNTFNKIAPSGNDYDTVVRINQDEYTKIYDKIIKIPGTSSGDNPSKMIRLNVPVKKYVSYSYDSALARKNAVYMISFICEASGVTPSALAVNTDGQAVIHFHDVVRTGKLP